MSTPKTEQIIKSVTAIMSFEDMLLTEQDKENVRRVIDGEITGDEIVSEIVNEYQNKVTTNG